ncbi:MAG: sel1 repeat family protein [Synergistaceae bacterium]|nr:sel1 repeat family protein [Synergistaceae bacterium]
MTKEKRAQIKFSLDPELFPETIDFLKRIKHAHHLSSYCIASHLIECDKTSVMTPELFNFVVECFEEEIKTGNHHAMNDLGVLYYDGRGYNQDFAKAVYYFEMAAAHGNRLSMENLGYCYYYGRSVPIDYEKAFNYFAVGAFEGEVISLYKIGDMYKNGYYVKKDLNEAFIIYSRCLDIISRTSNNYSLGPVCLRLGNAYFYGEGTNRDLKEALKFYQNQNFICITW